MKIVEYPFTRADGIIRPMVPIMFINPHNGKVYKEMAIIDTGADFCAFPQRIANFTGHNLKGDGVVTNVNNGIGGNAVPTWKHSFVMCLMDPTGVKAIKTSSLTLVSCFDHDNCPPLLGGNDFLKDVEVSFNYKKETITIRWE